MNKKMIALVLAAAFTVASVVAASAFTCKVTSVDGKAVTLQCKEKYTKKLKVGGKVKVSIKKMKAMEGC